MQKINLMEQFDLFSAQWQPKIVGELNGQYMKLAKLQGIFVWHHHQVTDQLFLVVQGRLKVEFQDGEVVLEPGEMVIVPAGVEHRPVAEQECWVLELAPKATPDAGPTPDGLTAEVLDWP